MSIWKPFLETGPVAQGIGAKESAIRNWIERDQFYPDGKKPSGRYKFTQYDLCVLAVVKSLLDYGVQVEGAVSVAQEVLSESRGYKEAKRDPRFDSVGRFSRALHGTAIRVIKADQDGWRWNYSAELSADTFIQIDVFSVVRNALRRAGLLAPLKGKEA